MKVGTMFRSKSFNVVGLGTHKQGKGRTHKCSGIDFTLQILHRLTVQLQWRILSSGGDLGTSNLLRYRRH